MPTLSKKNKNNKTLSPLRTIKNGTIFEKLCFIKIKLRRFYCKGCKKAFTERVSFLKQKQRSTLNHIKEVIFNLINQSFCGKEMLINNSRHSFKSSDGV